MANLYTKIAFIERNPDGTHKILGDLPVTGDPEESVLWRDAMWRAHGSIGNDTFAYVFARKVARVVDEPAPEPAKDPKPDGGAKK